jgi:putative transposase
MATGPNQSWSMDFVSDGFVDGWRLRCLNIVDDFTKECLAIEVDKSLLGRRVVGVLERLAEMRGGGCQRVSRWITGRSSSAKR